MASDMTDSQPDGRLTYEEAMEWFYVDNLGVLRWRKTPNARAPKGSVAGTIRDGYVRAQLGGRRYRAHRIVWLLTYGQWPMREIDHINGDKLDNRPDNLRDVSKRGNQQNLAIHRAGRLCGATLQKYGRWHARIQTDGKCRHIGVYATEQEAHEAYMAAAEAVNE